MNLHKATFKIFLPGVLFLVVSCDGFLDVNEDPTAPSEVPENLQLSALLGAFSYEVIGNEPARTPNLWVQQLAWAGFQENHADSYYFNESDPNNLWNQTYTEVLNNANQLNELAEENENYSYAGIAKVIQAWSFAILTDLFDEVPYTEAFNPLPEGTATPEYDSQEFIYNRIFELLQSALNDFESDDQTLSPGTDDLLYGGNIEQWQRLTNTLLARYHLRLSNAPGYDAEEQANNALGALENGFASNEDDADFQYYDNPGEENPWFQFAIDGKWDTRDQLSAHYIGLLEGLDDPRLSIQARPVGAVDNNGLVSGFDPEPDSIVYEGNVNGAEGDGASNYSSIGAFYSSADASLNWMSYAEAKFIEAEATLITGGDAQNIYEEGIRASMEKLGVAEGDIDDYINDPLISLTLPSASGDALEEIITQKYIANFLSLENYNDWRRTGYPELEPVEDPYTPSGQIPVRYPYPTSEHANNADNVAETGVPLGLSALEISVWWDTSN
ncbi:MAG: SusD/RagB family nutrient-binding outer membrane lipoprotein [Balneolales bacterium]